MKCPGASEADADSGGLGDGGGREGEGLLMGAVATFNLLQ